MINQTNPKRNFREKKVKLAELRWRCSPKTFKFKSTDQVEPLTSIIGQPRAVETIKLGSQLYSKGYNVFVTGLSGTGRMTTVKHILEEISTSCPIMYDFCYVNNFTDTSKPHLIRLQKGKGKEFAKKMANTIEFLRQRLPKIFEEEPYKSNRKKLIETYQVKENEVLEGFDTKIEPLGFVRGQLEAEGGIVIPEVFPVYKGKPITIDEVDELMNQGKIKLKEAEAIKVQWEQLHKEIYELSKVSMKLMLQFKKDLNAQDKAAVKINIDALFEDFTKNYKSPTVVIYIDEIKNYILENLHIFFSNSDDMPEFFKHLDTPDGTENADSFHIFKVNIFLDNSITDCAPIIIERNPNYVNLFGSFDKVADSTGTWKSDFSMIKAGSLLQADQGYLIVSAEDLFIDPAVWYSLKRVLLYGKLELQAVETFYQMTASHLKPEPININVKVIIIGGETLYRNLFFYEKGFKKIFKLNAQFDYETARTDDMVQKYAKFIAKICEKEKLSHCTPDGVGALIEWAVEHAGSQSRITLKFSDVADVLREANFYNAQKGKKYIGKDEVKLALEKRKFRNNLLDEKLKYEILVNDVLIDTKGSRIGQINGLTVIDNGSISLGKPARITATISAGHQGIINIEREVNMSGKIHNKGVMILTGFLHDRYSQKFPLTLTASIAFEQNYGGIDGDSATAAEIYCLLSAISGIPINQNLAITGSVNQKGDVQPIGGVIEKITGFYEICKERGFTGTNGVIIPEQNVKDLMLSEEIIESVRKKEFTIYSFKTIEEGTWLLMGIKFGELDEEGNYTKNSLSAKVMERLEELKILSKDDDDDDEDDKDDDKEKDFDEDDDDDDDDDEDGAAFFHKRYNNFIKKMNKTKALEEKVFSRKEFINLLVNSNKK